MFRYLLNAFIKLPATSVMGSAPYFSQKPEEEVILSGPSICAVDTKFYRRQYDDLKSLLIACPDSQAFYLVGSGVESSSLEAQASPFT